MLTVTLKTGVIGATERQKKTVLGLGLKYREATRELKETPAIRGMIYKVKHLVALVEGEKKINPLRAVPEYELGKISKAETPKLTTETINPSTSLRVKETHKKPKEVSKKEDKAVQAKSKKLSIKKPHTAKTEKKVVKKIKSRG